MPPSGLELGSRGDEEPGLCPAPQSPRRIRRPRSGRRMRVDEDGGYMAEITIQSGRSRERVPLLKERITIGRSRDSDIFLPDQWLSRQHAEILQKPDGYYVSDLGSKNETLLNGGRIHEQQRLRAGDIITLGAHILTFSLGESGDEEEEQDSDPVGTRVFSARELSDIKTKPAIDASELARQNHVLGVLSRAAESLVRHRSLDEIFEMVMDLLFEAVPAERGAILLLHG